MSYEDLAIKYKLGKTTIVRLLSNEIVLAEINKQKAE